MTLGDLLTGYGVPSVTTEAYHDFHWSLLDRSSYESRKEFYTWTLPKFYTDDLLQAKTKEEAKSTLDILWQIFQSQNNLNNSSTLCDCGEEKHHFGYHILGCPAGDKK